MQRFYLASVLVILGARAAQAQAPEVEVGEPHRSWVSTEYLLWWIRPDHVPGPLITTGPASLPGPGPLAQPTIDPLRGAAGNAGTAVLFAPSQLEYQSNSGVRLTLGRWLDPGQTLGIELAGFCLETHTIHGKADSSDQGVPLIARPFFNTQTGREEALVITAPGELIGGIDVFADSRLWGGEFNFLGAWRRDPGFRVDWLAGFRYLGLKDELRFSQGSQQMHWSEIHFLGVPVGEPAILSIKDLFETLNHFYGGQVGLRGELELGRITLGGSAKAGIGVTHQELSITGDTVLTDSGGNNQVALGGLYALPTNIGKSTHDRFAFVSEVNVQTGWRIGPRLSTFLGYSFLYWSAVARPGAEINRNIDPQQVPSSPTFDPLAATTQPARIFQSTAFWAQGINAGLEFRW